jgi:hypothetical protein
MSVDPFDLDALRLSPELQRQTRNGDARAQSRKWRRRFVKFPWTWVEKLRATNRAQTYHLALLILYEHWRTGGQDVVLSNAALEREGISRWSKWRGLGDMERLGLIRIEKRHRKAPRIRVLIDASGGPS